ncbi:MAG: carbon starvation CstA family protein, partial [Phycisphaerae bacterium]|nr:carbon starvation CstA family protein [Phycisphaerae bacterium]
MDTLLLMVFCFAAYILAYFTYGRFLGRKIFKLDPNKLVPSKEFTDGIDYVPSKKIIIFGHHFTSIAGTGPIVGPAIGIIWGWLPAVLWIVFGSIFMGAVHDLGSLVVSLRNKGKSISDITDKYINRRIKFIFFAVVFLALLIVLAIFGVVIAVVFARFPASVLAVWLQIPIAVAMGYMIYKKNANIVLSTIVAVACLYVTVWLGSEYPVRMPSIGAMPPTGVWTILLLLYAFVASTLPVTTLLQPRDYINAWQLFIMMALLVVAAVVSIFTKSMPLVAPMLNTAVPDAPPIFPFLFITI